VQLTNTCIVGSQIVDENSSYIREVERPRSQHLLDGRPVPTAIAKGLENGQVIVAEERELPVDQLMPTDMEAEVLVEGSRVQEDVDGDAIEHQPALARNTCQIGWAAQFLGEDQWPGHIR